VVSQGQTIHHHGGDNAELTLTALGVDYVEANATQIPILQKLLASGPQTTTGPEPVRDKLVRPQARLVSGESAAGISRYKPESELYGRQVSAAPGQPAGGGLK